MNEIAKTQLEEIADRLRDQYDVVKQASMIAIAEAKECGVLLGEARAICHLSGVSFSNWLRDTAKMPRDKARSLMSLHMNFTAIQSAIADQTTFDFMDSGRLLRSAFLCEPAQESLNDAAFSADIDLPDSAYAVPEKLSEDFIYPVDEEEDSGNKTIDAISSLFMHIVPRKLETRRDWRTFTVRIFGFAVLMGAVPPGVSMRRACEAIGVSHATISKYVNELSEKTGIRCQAMKPETARATYSRAQTENHWRRRG